VAGVQGRDWDTVWGEHYCVKLCVHRGRDDALDSVDDEEHVTNFGRVWACGLGLRNGDGLTLECAAQWWDVHRALATPDHRVPGVQGVHAEEDVCGEACDYMPPNGDHLAVQRDARANEAQGVERRAIGGVSALDVL
jgi:hypothetical protein